MSEETMHEAEWAEIERENRARDARLAAYREEELQRVLEAARASKRNVSFFIDELRKAKVMP